jgi:hypothetical protein
VSTPFLRAELPRGATEEYRLRIGDSVAFRSKGDPDPFVTVKRLGKQEVLVIIRADDERMTAADLELLAYEVVKA